MSKSAYNFLNFSQTDLISKLFLGFFGLTVSLIVSFLISEKFFFDKIFYKKSVLHGYHTSRCLHADSKHNWLDNWIISWREQDLKHLLSQTYIWPKTKSDVKTIVVIGDSYVYGTGVKPNETYSKRLPIELKKLGINARVIALAEPGNSILDYFALYRLARAQLNPDLVIIGLVVNDLFFHAPKYPNTRTDIKNFDQSCLQPMYEPGITDDLTNEEYIRVTTESFSAKWRNFCYLDQIAQLLKNDPKVIYFNHTSACKNLTCGPSDNEYDVNMTRYLQVLQSADIDGLSYVSSKPFLWEVVSEQENHPSVRAHREYAKQLSGYIANYFAQTQVE